MVVLDLDTLGMLGGGAEPCKGDGRLIVHLVEDGFVFSRSEVFKQLLHPICVPICVPSCDVFSSQVLFTTVRILREHRDSGSRSGIPGRYRLTDGYLIRKRSRHQIGL